MELSIRSDEELLATLLPPGPTSARTARKLMERAGSLSRMAAWEPPEFGGRHAERLAAAFELGRRSANGPPRGAPMTASRDVHDHFAPRLRHLRQEVFVAGLLDVKLRLVRDVRISLGSLSASLVHPREAFGAAVRENAHAVVFAHNHPSGDPLPSEDDAALTRRLVEAGDVLGIPVLDHVVIGDGDWFSFADEGRLRVPS